MSRKYIERCSVPLYNTTPLDTPALIPFNSGVTILDSAGDYTVVVESAAIDLKNVSLNPNPGYEIMVFCDLKDDTTPQKPPGLEWGANYFKFPGSIDNVEQLLQWFYEILHKKALPFDLGNIDLDKDDYFNLLITNDTYTQSYANDYFQVYFNQPLALLLEGLYNTTPIQAGGQLFYQMKTNSSGLYTQTLDTLHRLNKIESFLIHTTLPVTKTNISNASNGSVRPDPILSTIELNAMQYNLRSKSDWRYIPTVYRHTTLSTTSPVQNFDIWVLVQYTDGAVIAHTLAPSERLKVNLAFYPRGEEF